MNPVAILYTWFHENKQMFISCGAQLEFKDSGRDSAYVRFETDFHIMELCAWNHSFCLDIQITEIETENSEFLHAGSCESLEEFKEHLIRFFELFKVDFNRAR
ncbi:MAG: hypothetical protein EOO53_15250 [Gammaproteobacteria bacterium]|nr:MAG: hypothetical protein EOO53_15250 [Gammaproteobacteria bacterium]